MHEADRPDDEGKAHQHGCDTRDQEVGDKRDGILISVRPHPLRFPDGRDEHAFSGDIPLKDLKEAVAHTGKTEDASKCCNDDPGDSVHDPCLPSTCRLTLCVVNAH